MKIAYIYALRDPRDWRIRYIGKTVQKWEMRLRDHIRQAKRLSPETRETRHDRWINRLQEKNLKPRLELLEIVPDEDSIAAEKKWIAELKEYGHDLVNGNSGGAGCPRGKSAGFGKWTQERKLRHSRILTGRKKSEEVKKRIRETNLKFWRDNPHTNEHKKKISDAIKKKWAEMPQEIRKENIARKIGNLDKWRSLPGNEELRKTLAREGSKKHGS